MLNNLLIKSYIWILIALGIGVIMSELAVHFPERNIDQAEAQQYSKGYFNLMSEELKGAKADDWEGIVEKWQKNLFQAVWLEDLKKLSLSEPKKKQLNRNGFILLHDEDADEIQIVYKTSDPNRVVVYENRSIGMEFEERQFVFIETIEGLIVFLFVAIALFFIQYSVIKNITRLSRVFDEFGKGNLKRRSPADLPSPVKELAIDFNLMADRIEDLIKEQEVMTGAISHELRTPIGRIRFALDLAITESSPESKQKILEKMDTDVEEMARLTEDMLMFSRFLNIDYESKGEFFEVDLLLKQTIEPLEIFSSELKLESLCYIKKPIYGSFGDLVIALRNLVRNAQRYAHFKIQVTAEIDPAKMVHLVVEDDGPGIPPEKIAFIKMPFARLDSSRTRQTGGAGLGLAIVERIISAHGGTLEIDKSPLGGARFDLTWPLKKDKKYPFDY